MCPDLGVLCMVTIRFIKSKLAYMYTVVFFFFLVHLIFILLYQFIFILTFYILGLQIIPVNVVRFW